MKYTLVIAVLILTACFGKKPENTGMEGKVLPEFSLLLSDSITWINTKDIPTGMPAAFFLYSPSCPYCKSQITKIIDKIDELKDVKFYVTTLASIKEIQEFEKQFNLSKYANIKMVRDTANFLGQYLDVKGVPYLALYDKNKRLQRAFSGITDARLIKAIIVD